MPRILDCSSLLPLLRSTACCRSGPSEKSFNELFRRRLRNGKRQQAAAVQSDPGEHENIADRYPEKVSELKSLMVTWMKQAGAKDLTPNPAYDASRPLFNTRDETLKKARQEKETKK